MNRFLSLFSLLAVILWLLLRYPSIELLEGTQGLFPTVVMRCLAWISVGIFALFLLVQLIHIHAAVSIACISPGNWIQTEEAHVLQSNNYPHTAGELCPGTSLGGQGAG